jgi:hypothetical protein
MKTFKTKFSLTILALLLGIAIAIACAGGYEFEYGNSEFAPEVIADKKYSPFFYSYEYYYGIYYDTKHNERFNETITDDWYNFLDKKYSKNSIASLLVQGTTAQIDSVLKKQMPSRLQTNEVLKASTDKKVEAFLQFLKLSKTCESFALSSSDEWNYYGNDKPKPRKSSKDIILKLATAYTIQKDKFLKNRYWFQWVRACYFNEDYAATLLAFEKEANAEKNIIYYRTMGYYAGAFYKQKKYALSNYYFSLVFANCDALKTMAHYSFHPQQESDWQAALALCKTNEEKETLWQMLGIYYGDEIRSMKEIAAINPSSNNLEILLARSINKIENGAFDNTKESAPGIKSSAINSLQDFLVSMLSKNVKQSYKWQMALGYIYTLNKKFKEAEIQLTAAKTNLPNDALTKFQWRQLQLIYELEALTKLDTKTENRLLSEFQWIKEAVKDTNIKQARPFETYEGMKKQLTKIYRQQKDSVKAECFEVQPKFYASTKNCEAIKAFLKKTSKTPYEQFCESMYVFTYEDIVEYQAIQAFYNDKLDESSLLMEQSGENGASKLLSNPFNGGIKDCHDCDHALPQKTIYTKLSTLKKMKEMYAGLTTDIYNNALLLGNVYYNTTYFGSSRLFYECDIVGRGYLYPTFADKQLSDKLYDMTLAKKFYNMALNAAKTDEQKAKCAYMLAKCERNEWYGQSELNRKDNVDFVAWNGFKTLKNYSTTKYYKEVIKECGYFNLYVKGK